jgi:hypothetical protein
MLLAGCAVEQEVKPSVAEAVSKVRPYFLRQVFICNLQVDWFFDLTPAGGDKNADAREGQLNSTLVAL